MSYQLEKQVAFLTRKINHICACVRQCLGIDCANGDPNLYLNQTGHWTSPSGGGGSLIPMTYAQFLTAYNSSTLIPLSEVLITDFHMESIIQGTNTGSGDIVNIGNTEPMIIRILDTGLPDQRIFTLDPTNQADIIHWIPTVPFDGFWDHKIGSTGIIIYREDIFGNSRNYDFRNVVFRRWESSAGSGIYDMMNDTGFGHADFAPFPANSTNVKVTSPLFNNGNFNNYWLDNVVFQAPALNVTIGQSAYINALQGVQNLTIQNCYLIDFYNSVYTAKFGTAYNMTFNNGVIFVDISYSENCSFNDLQNVKILDAENNIIGGQIYACSFGEFFGNNITGQIRLSNVRQFIYNTITSVSNLTGSVLYNNTISGSIDTSTFEQISSNTLSNIQACTVNYIQDNSGNVNFLSLFGSYINNNEWSNDFIKSNFKTIENCSITGLIQNHTALAEWSSKTFTSTASMQAVTPSLSTWDTALGDVDVVLTAGTNVYTAF